MNQLGDWLGPAVAILWVLFRVLPRLLKGGQVASVVPEPKSLEIGTSPGGDSADSFESRPIVPR
jgi:hypothetical protein